MPMSELQREVRTGVRDNLLTKPERDKRFYDGEDDARRILTTVMHRRNYSVETMHELAAALEEIVRKNRGR